MKYSCPSDAHSARTDPDAVHEMKIEKKYNN